MCQNEISLAMKNVAGLRVDQCFPSTTGNTLVCEMDSTGLWALVRDVVGSKRMAGTTEKLNW